jgi:hypothetical protein
LTDIGILGLSDLTAVIAVAATVIIAPRHRAGE